MKKIILFLLVTTSLFGFSMEKERRDTDRVYLGTLDMFLDLQKELNRGGLDLIDYSCTVSYRMKSGKRQSFQFDLVKGVTYVFFTLTSGPRVITKITLDGNTGINKKFGSGSKFTNYYKAPITGSYHYHVIAIDHEWGVHKTNVGYISILKQGGI